MKPKVTHLEKSEFQTDKQVEQTTLEEIKEKIATDRLTGRLYAKTPLDDTQAVIFDGGLQTVLVRKPVEDEKCIIDWINITLDATQFFGSNALSQQHQQMQAINQVSKMLLKTIGFAVDVECETGRNFYDRCFMLENKAGFVCIGGQKDTILIMINGVGCNYALLNWEFNLFERLRTLQRVVITRIDLAYDSFDKRWLTVDLFDTVHSKGGFNKGGRNPEVEYRGNWKNPNGRGRSLYIGSRKSSKFCRIYEKGKQLGDPKSYWLRIEVEFKSRDIYIPLSVLLHPTDYFIAAYPCFFLIEESDFLSRYDTRNKNELLTFDKAFELVKKQYGRYLHFFRECYQDDTELLNQLTNIANKNVPEKLDIFTIPKHLKSPFFG